jgi:3-phenylpropionate/trans-cinnamate dioxygenase ferredoxin reductase subunit
VPSSNFVIIGAGLAGAKAAEALRDKDFDGQITLIGEEKYYPYERPPLSKDYLAGKADRESFVVHNSSWYADHDINLLLGKTAVKIDRAAHQVELADGSLLPYDKLLLATGSSPRVLPATANVRYLRRIEDSERLRQDFASASRLVVIGAGWIGLEVTAAARQAGLAVTVLEAAAAHRART